MTDQDAMQSSEPLIKPRVDEDGVGWCDLDCPSACYEPSSRPFIVCSLDDIERWTIDDGFCDLCPVHAHGVAQELKLKKQALADLQQWAERAREWAGSFAFHHPHLVPSNLLRDYPGAKGGE